MKPVRTIVIDYGEHHRMSISEQRPIHDSPLFLEEIECRASNDDSMLNNKDGTPNNKNLRTTPRRSNYFPEFAEDLLIIKKQRKT